MSLLRRSQGRDDDDEDKREEGPSREPSPPPTQLERLVRRVLGEIDTDTLGDREFFVGQIQLRAREVVADVFGGDNPAAAEALTRAVVHEMTGYGPLQPLLDDPNVTAITVKGPARVTVVRGGGVAEAVDVRFEHVDHIMRIADKMVGGNRSLERMDDGWLRVRIPQWMENPVWVAEINWTPEPVDGDTFIVLRRVTAVD